MRITITMDDDGRFNIDVSEGLPLFSVLGALETAKHILLSGDVNTSNSETIESEEVYSEYM